ncbi:MAG TPA: molybdopterin-dependent oxidoreductase, partial [Tepidiformaceae bacterium]|nr:molybdopterin-dependent oxidoreductase [Tepidiformaceae bacterium]
NRVSSSLDCGLVFNPEGARAQMEGAIIMGLGGTLFEAAEFEGGHLLTATFTRYRVPRYQSGAEDQRGAGRRRAPAQANRASCRSGRRLRTRCSMRRASASGSCRCSGGCNGAACEWSDGWQE